MCLERHKDRMERKHIHKALGCSVNSAHPHRCIFETFFRKNMGKKGKEEKKDSEDHNVHTLLGQPALVQIVERGLTGKSDQDKKVIIDMIFTTVVLAISLMEKNFQNNA